MIELYHYPLDAFGRLIRIYLRERSIDFQPIEEVPWQRKKNFTGFQMFSDLPTLVEPNGAVIESAASIIEYVEHNCRGIALWGISEKAKNETRRISSLFNIYFFAEVTNNIVFEKVIKRHVDRSSPDSASIRKGNGNIKKYFDYISWLTDRRNWLAGNDFSLADISAAAHISCIDYLGSIEWEAYPAVKDWYVRIKSRPSFRDILNDRISNISPVAHYADLDF